MPEVALKVGPVLSFRGISQVAGVARWCVTALIGVKAEGPAPALMLSGQVCPPPVLLHDHGGVKYWRYDLSVEMGPVEQKFTYGFGTPTQTWAFSVPKAGVAPRAAYVSCNGYGDPPVMRKLVRPANAAWADLLSNHDKSLRPIGYRIDKEQIWHEQKIHDQNLQRFHLLLMGGDQIYFDSIWEDIADLKAWVNLSREKQLKYNVTSKLRRQIYDYYMSLYGERWLPNKKANWSSREIMGSADAMASIPTVMMWDDHDIFDGWGSYTPEMQRSQVFQSVFAAAREAFWVFQLQHIQGKLPPLGNRFQADVSPDDPQFSPVKWTEILADDPLGLPILNDQPGFSFGFDLGGLRLLVADLRTERSRHQILSEVTWSALGKWLRPAPVPEPDNDAKCHHLLVMSSVPVAHPKLSLAEGVLDVFGRDDVLDSNADDLKDHWAHDDHEGERKRLIEILGVAARDRSCRATIVSGDVHVAAWGVVHRQDLPATANWGQIQQFTSSAIVHPSLSGVFERVFLSFLNSAASKAQYIDVDHRVEMMLFPGHNQYMMATRNWLALEMDDDSVSPRLWATWRCETPDSFSNHLYVVRPFNRGAS